MHYWFNSSKLRPYKCKLPLNAAAVTCKLSLRRCSSAVAASGSGAQIFLCRERLLSICILKKQVACEDEYLKQVLAETLTLLRTHCCIFASVEVKTSNASEGEA